ncbi:MAG: hypothetical protein ACFB3T_04675 [Geminicoccaceae bacterium]
MSGTHTTRPDAYDTREVVQAYQFFDGLRARGYLLDFDPQDMRHGIIGVWAKHRNPLAEHSTYLSLTKHFRPQAFFLRRTRYMLECSGSGLSTPSHQGCVLAWSLRDLLRQSGQIIVARERGEAVSLMERKSAFAALAG